VSQAEARFDGSNNAGEWEWPQVVGGKLALERKRKSNPIYLETLQA
jgi:hypothetical protein